MSAPRAGRRPSPAARPQMETFAAAYRDAFTAEPDAFALAQYDGTRMVLAPSPRWERTRSACATGSPATAMTGSP